MNAIEIFAGAGGAALGLHRAGIQALAMVEWDHHAASTLRAAMVAVSGAVAVGLVVAGDLYSERRRR